MAFNEQRALAILDIQKPASNCERVEFGYSELKALRLLNLINGDDCQNDSPTVDEFLEFCETNGTSEEEVIFEAYIVTNRPDARVTVEGIRLLVALSGEKTKRDFINQFRCADEFEVQESVYRAWWD